MAGMPAEANALAIRSFRAWCLADLPGARLQAKLWRPCASIIIIIIIIINM